MTLPRRLLPLLFACLAVGLIGSPSAAKKRARGPSPLIPSEFLPIPPEQLALESVAFAAGAPAVVLLSGKQTTYHPEYAARREVRRVKILTEAGVHQLSDFSVTWWGEVRLGEIEARTVLPDGTVIPAGDGLHVVKEKDPDSLSITVGFPRVQVGAILDLRYELRGNSLSVNQYIVQEALPVLESRYLIAPRKGQRFRTGLVRMSDKMVEKSDFGFGTERMHAWVFREVPALPAVPHRPPASDIARKLLLVNEGYFRFGRQFPYAADWKSLISNHRSYYDGWLKTKNRKVKAFARSLAPGGATPQAKAETVRTALRERFIAIRPSDFPTGETADEVLDRGRGSSADAALLAIIMLRELGVDAYPAACRLRSTGSIPTDVPVPNLLNELLVVVPGAGSAGQDLTWSPAVDQPVTVPSSDRVGILAVPYRRGSRGPVTIPDLPAEQNSLRRNLVLQPALDGSLSGDLTVTATGHHAQTWRRALRARDEEGQREWIENRLDNQIGSLRVDLFQIEGLERAGSELIVDLQFSADSALTRAGGRLLLNPFLFDRVDAADWSAEKRQLDLQLGRPSETVDSVLIQLPAGIEDVRLPQPLKLDAGPVGAYVSDYSGDGRRLRCSRRHSLKQTLFRAAAYEPLKAWFTDAAKGDEQAIVLKLDR